MKKEPEAAYQNLLWFAPTASFCRDAGLRAVTHAFCWQSQRGESFSARGSRLGRMNICPWLKQAQQNHNLSYYEEDTEFLRLLPYWFQWVLIKPATSPSQHGCKVFPFPSVAIYKLRWPHRFALHLPLVLQTSSPNERMFIHMVATSGITKCNPPAYTQCCASTITPRKVVSPSSKYSSL